MPTLPKTKYKFAIDRMSRTASHGCASDFVWETYRDTIFKIYLIENRSLQDVMNEMEKVHGIAVTKARLEHYLKKWNFRKNLTRDEWSNVASKIQKRKRDQKDSEVCIHGIPMKRQKVLKATTRYGCRSTAIFQAASPRTPPAVTIRTPVTELVNSDTVCISPISLSATSDPKLYGLTLASGLPFSTFNSMIREKAISYLSQSDSSNVSSFLSRLLAIESSILAYFSTEAEPQATYNTDSVFRNIENLMPHHLYPVDMANMQLRHSHHPSDALDFLDLTLFLVSNKFFQPDSTISMNVYDWIQQGPETGLLGYFLSIGGPTAEAILEHLVSLAIKRDDAETLKKLLRSGVDPNELRYSHAWGQPKTLIQRACEMRSKGLVQVLLEAGANIENSQPGHSSPLYCALSNWNDDCEPQGHIDADLVRMLLQAGASVNPSQEESPLLRAATVCHLELIILLLAAGADPNFSEPDFGDSGRYGGKTPLIAVIESNGICPDVFSAVCHMLQAGADANAKVDGHPPWTVLQYAICRGGDNLIQTLLSHGAQIGEGELAAAVHSLSTIKLFLDYGARVTTPVIEEAVSRGDPNVTWLLLDGVEENAKEYSREQALVASILHGKVDVFHRLSTRGTALRQSSMLSAAIRSAADRGDKLMLQSLLNRDSPHRETVLQSLGHSLRFAIARGHSEVVELLLNVGADVNCRNHQSTRTPLLEAVLRQNQHLVQRLLAAGAAVNTMHTDSDGAHRRGTDSVLPAVVRWGNHSLIQDVINAGADVNAPDQEGGMTALTTAVELGDMAIVQTLLDAGADVNATAAAYFGHTALSAAVGKNDINMVRFLLRLGADVKQRTLLIAVGRDIEMMKTLLTTNPNKHQRHSQGFGTRALQYAICRKDDAMIDVLLQNGVDVDSITRTQYGEHQYPHEYFETRHLESPLGTAIRYDESEDLWMVQMLLSAGADPNKFVRELPDDTALLAAIRKNNLRLVKLLISIGANINPRVVGRPRRSPLQLAVEKGFLDIIAELLVHGADVNAPPSDRDGATALQLAAINGHLDMVSNLIQKGADVNAPPAKIQGRTAIEGAAEHGHIDTLQFLLQAGARVTGSGAEQYEKARRLASENGHVAARRMLESHHAHQLNSYLERDVSTPHPLLIEDMNFSDWLQVEQDDIN